VLAFALGMVHALMPGHGKTVVFSYLMGNDASLVTGIAMAMKIAGLHVGAAVVLLLVIGAAVVRFGRMQGAGRVLEMGSYLAVAAMGAWLLWRAPGCEVMDRARTITTVAAAVCSPTPSASRARRANTPRRPAGGDREREWLKFAYE
jgi:ABC-type nickel/cobalt efflux system permease component RcnA